MKTNPYDEITKKVLKRIEQASDRLASQYKGIKPYDEKRIPGAELLRAYDGLDSEDMQFLIQRHGEEKVDEFIQEMERERLKQLERSYGLKDIS